MRPVRTAIEWMDVDVRKMQHRIDESLTLTTLHVRVRMLMSAATAMAPSAWY